VRNYECLKLSLMSASDCKLSYRRCAVSSVDADFRFAEDAAFERHPSSGMD
jgi:hypothetical protein